MDRLKEQFMAAFCFEDAMSKELLIMNFRESSGGPSWDFIPSDLWEFIVREFIVKICDSFSMDCLSDPKNVASILPFNDFQPSVIGTKKYSPFHLPDNVKDAKDYMHEQVAYEFDQHIGYLILRVEFGSWNVGNDETPADELIFWHGDVEKILAVPYEGMIFFSNLTANERAMLLEVDSRIKPNLQSRA